MSPAAVRRIGPAATEPVADNERAGMAERLELLIAERRIQARVTALARRIDADYHGNALSLVVVLKGAVVFAADLLRRITIPVTLDFIAAASYGAAAKSSGTVAVGGLDRLEPAGRPISVMQELLDAAPPHAP